MKDFLVLCLLSLSGLLMACFPEEQRLNNDPHADLHFSVDTLHFDTLFTGERSTARRARVLNPSREAVNIRQISFTGGVASPFSIWVEGRKGKMFKDVRILGKDSLLLLCEVDLPAGTEVMPQQVDETLRLNVGMRAHVLPIRAWGQDVLREEEALIIDEDQTWTGIPRIIGTGLRIEAGSTLHLEAGMRLFFREDAFCEVKGTLRAVGTVEAPVTFSFVRQDEFYEESIGQWTGLSFLAGSTDNDLQHVEIANAEIALQLSTPMETEEVMLRLSHGVIKHMSVGGILAYGSRVEATNVLIYDCGEYILNHLAGGHYRYQHVSFINTFTTAFRRGASFRFSDYLEEGEQLRTGALQLHLQNSILWGSLEEEMVFDLREESRLQLDAEDNILYTGLNERFSTEHNTLNQTRNFLRFIDPLERNYRLMHDSPACGDGVFLAEVQQDLEERPRKNPPAIGAYACEEEP